ncbi:MAG: phage Gp37/Gp68 family protein [Rhizobiales bacterium]|nr:phage Gp37/Gp68 family protein [Hyphomicrobiales bacterium]
MEWTDATWNPIVGCSVVSPGCTNSYAMSMARRIEAMHPASHYAGTAIKRKGGPVWTGEVRLAPDHIVLWPLRSQKPRRIFVNSMGDLFHEAIPDAWIDRVFAIMALAPQHTFQVLTKRADRMRAYCSSLGGHHERDRVSLAAKTIFEETGFGGKGFWYTLRGGGAHLPNVWLGVSAEDQRRANERVPDLLHTPAARRFISAEPLLGPLDLSEIRVARRPGVVRVYRPLMGYWAEAEDLGNGGLRSLPAAQKASESCGAIDQVIAGGESGPNARPMNPAWALSLRDQLQDFGTSFFFKQWGEWAPAADTHSRLPHHTFEDGRIVRRVGKHASGRRLDGQHHDAIPGALS